jgi:O-antigen/teichoic acid export membrane protein
MALFRRIILLMGVTVATGFPFRVFNGVLASYLRHDSIAFISIIRTLGANALIYFFLDRGGGILTLALVNCGASLFEYLATYTVCRIQYPDVKISLKKFDRAGTAQLFAYSGKTLLIQFADLLRFRVDALVIAAYLNVSLVTYYSVGSRLIDYFGSFMVSTIGFVSPLFSKYEGQGDFTSLRNRFLDVTRICTTISVFIGASIVFYGKTFMERWMGPGFESSYHIAVILGIPATIALTQSPGLQLLYGVSKHHYYAVSNTLEGLLNLALSVFLVQHYGMYGVALGTAGEMFLFKIFIQPVLICRAAGLSVTDYLLKTIFLTAAKTLVPLLAYFYVMSKYIRPDYPNMFSIVFIQSLLFLPLLYFAVLNRDMKQRIRVALRLS